MPRVAFRRRDGGFTMLELIVSVGLMAMLLSVLAFVFNHSAEAVSQANEAVNTVQKARNFEARLGRELAAAVRYAVASGTSPQRAFWIDGNSTYTHSARDPDSADYETSIEFVSRTMQDGILQTWDVKYEFVNDEGKNYGAIRRKKDAPDQVSGEYVLWDKKDEGGVWEEKDEILAWPVRGVYFEAAGDWNPGTTENQNTELPSYVRVKVTFLDSWGGEAFILPMDFCFPIYQGG